MKSFTVNFFVFFFFLAVSNRRFAGWKGRNPAVPGQITRGFRTTRLGQVSPGGGAGTEDFWRRGDPEVRSNPKASRHRPWAGRRQPLTASLPACPAFFPAGLFHCLGSLGHGHQRHLRDTKEEQRHQNISVRQEHLPELYSSPNSPKYTPVFVFLQQQRWDLWIFPSPVPDPVLIRPQNFPSAASSVILLRCFTTNSPLSSPFFIFKVPFFSPSSSPLLKNPTQDERGGFNSSTCHRGVGRSSRSPPRELQNQTCSNKKGGERRRGRGAALPAPSVQKLEPKIRLGAGRTRCRALCSLSRDKSEPEGGKMLLTPQSFGSSRSPASIPSKEHSS